jgi:hypothetical protein
MDLVIIAFMKGMFWTGIIELVLTIIIKIINNDPKIEGGFGDDMLLVGAICALLKAKAIGLI